MRTVWWMWINTALTRDNYSVDRLDESKNLRVYPPFKVKASKSLILHIRLIYQAIAAHACARARAQRT